MYMLFKGTFRELSKFDLMGIPESRKLKVDKIKEKKPEEIYKAKKMKTAATITTTKTKTKLCKDVPRRRLGS